MNFQFPIMKKLWDLAQENVVNIQGSYGILDQYLWSQNSKFCIREDIYYKKKKSRKQWLYRQKKYLWGGSLPTFFFLEVSAKKRKTLEKKHGLWEIRSFISCQSRGGGKWIVRSVRFSFVPFISILHTLYHKVSTIIRFFTWGTCQRYTYRVLQTIQMKLILLWVWAEGAVLGRAKTALKFKYEI